jgi:hypothetical protein
MPVISMFYGLIVRLYSFDVDKHKLPHLHVEYAGNEAVVAIPTGEILTGTLPANKLKLLLAWMEIHQDELLADWKLAVNGEPIFRIEPLR